MYVRYPLFMMFMNTSHTYAHAGEEYAVETGHRTTLLSQFHINTNKHTRKIGRLS